MTGLGSGWPSAAPSAALPPALRRHLARLFGADLRSVRVAVSDAPLRMGALALAYGETVLLSPLAAALDNHRRRAVLGHEIAHVLQQRAGAPRGLVRPDSGALEAEASRAGRRVAAGRTVAQAARTARRSIRTVQRIKLSIKGTAEKNGADGELDAATLLNILDTSISTKVKDRTGVTGALTFGSGLTVTLSAGAHWLDVLGRLFSYDVTLPGGQERKSMLDCVLKIGESKHEFAVKKLGGTERLDFGSDVATWVNRPKGEDLSYKQIAQGFTKLNSAGHTDAALARDLILIMMGNAPLGTYQAAEKTFLVGMVGLMFGVEASRFPSAVVTSLFLLDLIRSGKKFGRGGGKSFTLAGAFDKPDTKFDFDCMYGGKFPCAVHTPGPGNTSNRMMLGRLGGSSDASTREAGGFTRAKGLEMTMELNHRFVVPRREVSLLIHWIEAMTSDVGALTKTSIQGLITTRMDQAFKTATLPATLPHSPRTDTGLHTRDVGGAKPTLADLMKPDNEAKVYWTPNGKFFHSLQDCKMFGDRTQGRKDLLEASFLKKNAKKAPVVGPGPLWSFKITTGTLSVVTSDDPKGQWSGKSKCTYCIS
jgi:hypothetical protein